MSNINLSISIMHCSSFKSRRTMLNKVLSKIDKRFLHSLHISDDPTCNGIWWNYKKALNLRHKDATHHLVLQDDMIPCDNFVNIVLKLINKMPEEVIHIFASSYHYKDMLNSDNNIFRAKGGVWGGSVILPKKHFKWDLWVEKYFDNNIIGKHLDDERMFLYLFFNKIDMYCITPGLLQHVGNNSLIGSISGRTAFTYMDKNNIDWDNISLNNIPNAGFIWGSSIKEVKKSLNYPYKKEFIEKYGNGNIKNIIKMMKNKN